MRSSSSIDTCLFEKPKRIPLLLVSCCSDCFFTPTVTLFAPSPAKVEDIDEVSDVLTVMMAITEPMPMMMPSMVSTDLILLPSMPAKASLIFSHISICASYI